MYYKISYEKPKDAREFKDLNYLEKILRNKKIIIEEKIDGTLSDNFNEACIELDSYNKIFCLYGENLDVGDFHMLHYFSPSKRIIFDCAIIGDEKKIYLSPEMCINLVFNIGGIFVPILYYGIYPSLQKILKLLNETSIFPNEVNKNLIEVLNNEEKKVLGNRIINFREGIVIKSYKGSEFCEEVESYKIVNLIFEEFLRKYPREKYKQLYLPNIIKPFSYEDFKKYWNENIFNKLGLKINEEEFIRAYENYLQCYNKKSVKECIESNRDNEKYFERLIKKLSLKLYN